MSIDQANTVHLLGRVSAVLDERVLPSGDTVVPLRVVVPRPRPAGETSSGGSRATVDVIDVACWAAAARQVAGDLTPGDRVEVHGSLHRRFFRGGSGVQSRYEVSAHRLTRCDTSARSTTSAEPSSSAESPTSAEPSSGAEPTPGGESPSSVEPRRAPSRRRTPSRGPRPPP